MTETFWIITKLVNKQYSIYHLKMFQILFICYFCFYFTFTVYTNVLNTVVFMVRKGKSNLEKQFRSQLPRLLKLSVVSNPHPPHSRLLVFAIFSNHPYSSTHPVYQRPQSNRNSRFQSFYMTLPLFHLFFLFHDWYKFQKILSFGHQN